MIQHSSVIAHRTFSVDHTHQHQCCQDVDRTHRPFAVDHLCTDTLLSSLLNFFSELHFIGIGECVCVCVFVCMEVMCTHACLCTHMCSYGNVRMDMCSCALACI